MTHPTIPEIPHPGAPPGPAPQTEPTPAVPPSVIEEPLAQLRARRRLLLSGPIDERTATRVCAELMLLDGSGDAPVELIINSVGGPVAAATAVTDVIALMRAPVRTHCIGTAIGTAAVVLASGTGDRAATARAILSLRVDDLHEIDGRASDIQREAHVLAQQRRRVAEHLATVSTLSVDAAAIALRDGEPLTVTEALAIGLIDDVLRR